MKIHLKGTTITNNVCKSSIPSIWRHKCAMNEWILSFSRSHDYPLASFITSYRETSTNHEASRFSRLFAPFGYLRNLFFRQGTYNVRHSICEKHLCSKKWTSEIVHLKLHVAAYYRVLITKLLLRKRQITRKFPWWSMAEISLLQTKKKKKKCKSNIWDVILTILKVQCIKPIYKHLVT